MSATAVPLILSAKPTPVRKKTMDRSALTNQLAAVVLNPGNSSSSATPNATPSSTASVNAAPIPQFGSTPLSSVRGSLSRRTSSTSSRVTPIATASGSAAKAAHHHSGSLSSAGTGTGTSLRNHPPPKAAHDAKRPSVSVPGVVAPAAISVIRSDSPNNSDDSAPDTPTTGGGARTADSDVSDDDETKTGDDSNTARNSVSGADGDSRPTTAGDNGSGIGSAAVQRQRQLAIAMATAAPEKTLNERLAIIDKQQRALLADTAEQKELRRKRKIEKRAAREQKELRRTQKRERAEARAREIADRNAKEAAERERAAADEKQKRTEQQTAALDREMRLRRMPTAAGSGAAASGGSTDGGSGSISRPAAFQSTPPPVAGSPPVPVIEIRPLFGTLPANKPNSVGISGPVTNLNTGTTIISTPAPAVPPSARGKGTAAPLPPPPAIERTPSLSSTATNVNANPIASTATAAAVPPAPMQSTALLSSSSSAFRRAQAGETFSFSTLRDVTAKLKEHLETLDNEEDRKEQWRRDTIAALPHSMRMQLENVDLEPTAEMRDRFSELITGLEQTFKEVEKADVFVREFTKKRKKDGQLENERLDSWLKGLVDVDRVIAESQDNVRIGEQHTKLTLDHVYSLLHKLQRKFYGRAAQAGAQYASGNRKVFQLAQLESIRQSLAGGGAGHSNAGSNGGSGGSDLKQEILIGLLQAKLRQQDEWIENSKLPAGAQQQFTVFEQKAVELIQLLRHLEDLLKEAGVEQKKAHDENDRLMTLIEKLSKFESQDERHEYFKRENAENKKLIAQKDADLRSLTELRDSTKIQLDTLLEENTRVTKRLTKLQTEWEATNRALIIQKGKVRTLEKKHKRQLRDALQNVNPMASAAALALSPPGLMSPPSAANQTTPNAAGGNRPPSQLSTSRAGSRAGMDGSSIFDFDRAGGAETPSGDGHHSGVQSELLDSLKTAMRRLNEEKANLVIDTLSYRRLLTEHRINLPATSPAHVSSTDPNYVLALANHLMSLHKQLVADAAVAAANKAAGIDTGAGGATESVFGHARTGSRSAVPPDGSPRGSGATGRNTGSTEDGPDDADAKDLKPIDETYNSDTSTDSDAGTGKKKRGKKKGGKKGKTGKHTKRRSIQTGTVDSDSSDAEGGKKLKLGSKQHSPARHRSPRRGGGGGGGAGSAKEDDEPLIGADGKPLLNKLSAKYDATQRKLKEIEIKHKRLESEHTKLLRNYERTKHAEHTNREDARRISDLKQQLAAKNKLLADKSQSKQSASIETEASARLITAALQSLNGKNGPLTIKQEAMGGTLIAGASNAVAADGKTTASTAGTISGGGVSISLAAAPAQPAGATAAAPATGGIDDEPDIDDPTAPTVGPDGRPLPPGHARRKSAAIAAANAMSPLETETERRARVAREYRELMERQELRATKTALEAELTELKRTHASVAEQREAQNLAATQLADYLRAQWLKARSDVIDRELQLKRQTEVLALTPGGAEALALIAAAEKVDAATTAAMMAATTGAATAAATSAASTAAAPAPVTGAATASVPAVPGTPATPATGDAATATAPTTAAAQQPPGSTATPTPTPVVPASPAPVSGSAATNPPGSASPPPSSPKKAYTLADRKKKAAAEAEEKKKAEVEAIEHAKRAARLAEELSKKQAELKAEREKQVEADRVVQAEREAEFVKLRAYERTIVERDASIAALTAQRDHEREQFRIVEKEKADARAAERAADLKERDEMKEVIRQLLEEIANLKMRFTKKENPKDREFVKIIERLKKEKTDLHSEVARVEAVLKATSLAAAKSREEMKAREKSRATRERERDAELASKESLLKQKELELEKKRREREIREKGDSERREREAREAALRERLKERERAAKEKEIADRLATASAVAAAANPISPYATIGNQPPAAAVAAPPATLDTATPFSVPALSTGPDPTSGGGPTTATSTGSTANLLLSPRSSAAIQEEKELERQVTALKHDIDVRTAATAAAAASAGTSGAGDAKTIAGSASADEAELAILTENSRLNAANSQLTQRLHRLHNKLRVIKHKFAAPQPTGSGSDTDSGARAADSDLVEAVALEHDLDQLIAVATASHNTHVSAAAAAALAASRVRKPVALGTMAGLSGDGTLHPNSHSAAITSTVGIAPAMVGGHAPPAHPAAAASGKTTIFPPIAAPHTASHPKSAGAHPHSSHYHATQQLAHAHQSAYPPTGPLVVAPTAEQAANPVTNAMPVPRPSPVRHHHTVGQAGVPPIGPSPAAIAARQHAAAAAQQQQFVEPVSSSSAPQSSAAPAQPPAPIDTPAVATTGNATATPSRTTPRRSTGRPPRSTRRHKAGALGYESAYYDQNTGMATASGAQQVVVPLPLPSTDPASLQPSVVMSTTAVTVPAPSVSTVIIGGDSGSGSDRRGKGESRRVSPPRAKRFESQPVTRQQGVNRGPRYGRYGSDYSMQAAASAAAATATAADGTAAPVPQTDEEWIVEQFRQAKLRATESMSQPITGLTSTLNASDAAAAQLQRERAALTQFMSILGERQMNPAQLYEVLNRVVEDHTNETDGAGGDDTDTGAGGTGSDSASSSPSQSPNRSAAARRRRQLRRKAALEASPAITGGSTLDRDRASETERLHLSRLRASTRTIRPKPVQPIDFTPFFDEFFQSLHRSATAANGGVAGQPLPAPRPIVHFGGTTLAASGSEELKSAAADGSAAGGGAAAGNSLSTLNLGYGGATINTGEVSPRTAKQQRDEHRRFMEEVRRVYQQKLHIDPFPSNQSSVDLTGAVAANPSLFAPGSHVLSAHTPSIPSGRSNQPPPHLARILAVTPLLTGPIASGYTTGGGGVPAGYTVQTSLPVHHNGGSSPRLSARTHPVIGGGTHAHHAVATAAASAASEPAPSASNAGVWRADVAAPASDPPLLTALHAVEASDRRRAGAAGAAPPLEPVLTSIAVPAGSTVSAQTLDVLSVAHAPVHVVRPPAATAATAASGSASASVVVPRAIMTITTTGSGTAPPPSTSAAYVSAAIKSKKLATNPASLQLTDRHDPDSSVVRQSHIEYFGGGGGGGSAGASAGTVANTTTATGGASASGGKIITPARSSAAAVPGASGSRTARAAQRFGGESKS